jgi:hypothetical protein
MQYRRRNYLRDFGIRKGGRRVRTQRDFNYYSLKEQVLKMSYCFLLDQCSVDQIIQGDKNILIFRMWSFKKPTMTNDEKIYTMILIYLDAHSNDLNLNIEKLEDKFCKIKNISPYVFLNLLNVRKINSIKIKTHFLTQLIMNHELRQHFSDILEIAIKNNVNFVVDYLHGLRYLATDHNYVINTYLDDCHKIDYLLTIGYEISPLIFIKISSKYPTINIPNNDTYINNIISSRKQSDIIKTVGSFGSPELYDKLISNGWKIKTTNINKLYQYAVNKCNVSLAKKIIIEHPKKWMVKKLFNKISRCPPHIFDKYSRDVTYILKLLNYKSFDDSLYPLIHKRQILDYPMENYNYHLSDSQILHVFNHCLKTDNLDNLKKLIHNRIIDPIDLSKKKYLLLALEHASINIARYLMTDLKLRCTDKEIDMRILGNGTYKYRYRNCLYTTWSFGDTKKILKLMITVGGYKPSIGVCEKFVTNYNLFVWLLNNGGNISRLCFKKSIKYPNKLRVATFLFNQKDKYNQDTDNIIQYLIQKNNIFRYNHWSLESIIKIIKQFNITINQSLIRYVIIIDHIDLLKYLIKTYKLTIAKEDAVFYFMNKHKYRPNETMIKYLIKTKLDLSDIDWENMIMTFHTGKIHKIINSKYDINYSDKFISDVIACHKLTFIKYIIKNKKITISKNNILIGLMTGSKKIIEILVSRIENINFTIKDMNSVASNSCRYSITPIKFMMKYFNIQPTIYTLELLVLRMSPFAHHELIPLIKMADFVTLQIINTLTGDAHIEASKKPIQEYQILPEEIPDIIGNDIFFDEEY